jgi:hypothetical protein
MASAPFFRLSSFCLALLLAFSIPAHANVAQPGFWSAGGTGSFSLLYAEDSLAYQQIQMVKEQVSIQLYKGFAVVKGSYWLYNTSADSFSIRVGYPINSLYDPPTGNYRSEIRFDSLSRLQARINGEAVSLTARPLPEEAQAYENQNENWYIWRTEFPPEDTTRLEVFFILNTSQTRISEGYSRKQSQGFIYLLETGAIWKQPIRQGEIRIQLKDGLSQEDIAGLAPGSAFRLDAASQTLRYRFEDLTPGESDNVVIDYGGKVKDFDFASVLPREQILFEEIEAFSAKTLATQDFADHDFGDPYDIPDTATLMFVGMAALVIGVPLLILAGIIILVVYLVRKRKRRISS